MCSVDSGKERVRVGGWEGKLRCRQVGMWGRVEWGRSEGGTKRGRNEGVRLRGEGRERHCCEYGPVTSQPKGSRAVRHGTDRCWDRGVLVSVVLRGLDWTRLRDDNGRSGEEQGRGELDGRGRLGLRDAHVHA